MVSPLCAVVDVLHALLLTFPHDIFCATNTAFEIALNVLGTDNKCDVHRLKMVLFLCDNYDFPPPPSPFASSILMMYVLYSTGEFCSCLFFCCCNDNWIWITENLLCLLPWGTNWQMLCVDGFLRHYLELPTFNCLSTWLKPLTW